MIYDIFISDSRQDDDSCSYNCQNDGGCEVRKDGWLGSCFSPSFGGECHGTPPGCSDCSQKCQGKNGSIITSNSNSRSSDSSFGRNSGSSYSTSGSHFGGNFGSSYEKRYSGSRRRGGLARLVDGFAGMIG